MTYIKTAFEYGNVRASENGFHCWGKTVWCTVPGWTLKKRKQLKTILVMTHSRVPRVSSDVPECVALVQNPPASPCSRVMFSVLSHHLLFLTSFSDPLCHILDPDIDTHLPPVNCTQQIASGHSSNVFISVHLPVLPENVSNTDFSLRGKISNAE